MVNIGSVTTAEIFLIWTNVTRTNVAWTNATVTVQETYLKILVKIGSVTAEIILIWTNVTRANVAWTKVIVTVKICSRCYQEPTLKVSSKSDQ